MDLKKQLGTNVKIDETEFRAKYYIHKLKDATDLIKSRFFRTLDSQ